MANGRSSGGGMAEAKVEQEKLIAEA